MSTCARLHSFPRRAASLPYAAMRILAQSYAGYKTCLAASRSEISLSHPNGAGIRVLQSPSAELHPIVVSTSATDFARTAPYSAIFAAQVVCSTTEGSKISFLCCSIHALACVRVPSLVFSTTILQDPRHVPEPQKPALSWLFSCPDA